MEDGAGKEAPVDVWGLIVSGIALYVLAEREEEERSGCGEEELEGGGVGKVKEVCCREGVVEVEEESVGEAERMAG